MTQGLSEVSQIQRHPASPTLLEIDMRNTTQLIGTLVLAAFGSVAMAAEASLDSPTTGSQFSRAEVHAAAVEAVQTNGVVRGEGGFEHAPVEASNLSRAQVRAEAREALRLGLVQRGEATVRDASAAELAQIRNAGMRAIGADTVVAAR
jgi:hypothetical protein